jgi:hypothetical protein
MPNLGAIFIDDDANGKGWFLDSTPWITVNLLLAMQPTISKLM